MLKQSGHPQHPRFQPGIAQYQSGLLASLIALMPLIGALYPKPVVADNVVQVAQDTEAIQAEADRLLEQGFQHYRVSEFTAAQAAWEQSLKLYRQIHNRKGEGQSLGNLGITYDALGNYPKAIEYHEQALAIAREIKNRKGEGQSLTNLGAVYIFLGNYPKAMEYLEQALAIARELHDRQSEGKSLGNLGIIYKMMGNSPKALEYQEQRLAIAREIQDRPGEKSALGNLGNTYYGLGNYPKAIDYHQQSLAIARAIQDRHGEGQSLGNLGLAYYGLGNYSQAIAYQEQRLAIAQAIQDRLGEGQSLGNLGLAYDALGDYPKAIDYHQQALAIARKIQDRLGEEKSLGNLGIVHHVLGNDTKAIEYHQQALAIEQEIKDRRGEGRSLGNLGLIYNDLGQYAKAIEYHQQALAIAREVKDRRGEGKTLGNLGLDYRALKNYPKALEYEKQALAIAREIKDQQSEGLALSNLGVILFDTNQLKNAEAPLQQSIQVFESLRQGLGDTQKVSIADVQISPYITLQQVLIAQKRIAPALEVAERGRARAFVELLTQRHTQTANPTIQPISLAEIIQVAKTEKATLVEYSNLRDQQLGIWVVSPTGKVNFRQVDLKPLTEAKSSLDKLVTLSRCFGNPSCETRVAARSAQTSELPDPELLKDLQTDLPNQYLKTLYQLLIQPIADLLPSDPNAKVGFAPQGALFLTPFAALQDQQNRYLIDQHTILTIPSIQVLQRIQQLQQQRKPPQNNNPLVVGNPRPMAGKLPPLLGAEGEAIEVAKLLNTQPILHEQATKSGVLQRMKEASLIHLATHGTWDGNNGLNSKIALAPVDGFLTAAEILDLKLKADLVVLSACDSGRGKVTGDGVIGLSRSLFSAGVPSIVATLWPIPDEATKFLMIDFYKNLQARKDKAQALRSAMIKTKATYPKPKDWAAFLLIGSSE